jgi:transposase
MVYLFKKKLKGKYYLYLGENQRVNGVPTRISSKYLGPYEKFENYFTKKDTQIENVSHNKYGLCSALDQIFEQFLFSKIVKNKIKKRNKDPYIDKIIKLLVMNRLSDPCAKYSLAKWFKKIELSNSLNIPNSELQPNKIYRAMDQLEKYSGEIEEEICKIIKIQEDINLDMLYLDFSNQESYSTNKDSECLKHGLNKRNRHDLLQINLSLSCDTNSSIPFFHKVYPGNYNDKQFIKIYTDELRKKLDAIGNTNRNTLIIDRGINGLDNFKLLRENKFDYIGGLTEQFFDEFFSIPKFKLRRKYVHKRVDKKDLEINYADFTKEIYDDKHLIICAYSEENYEEKKEELDLKIKNYINKCENLLKEYREEIFENTFKSRKNNVENILNKLKKINKKLFSVIDFNLSSIRFNLTWEIKINQKEYLRLQDKFGKFILFTNKLDYKPKEIINLYFKKANIEKNYHYLKSNGYTNRYIQLGPMLHSKDDRIKSHTYICVLALQFYQIINHRLKKKGLNISPQEAIEELKNITRYRVKIKDENLKEFTTKISENQKKICQALDIDL